MGKNEKTGTKGDDNRRSSPAARGGAGVYIEGELGAFYLLALLAGTEPRGLPGARLERVRFQGEDLGYALDDLILHGNTAVGPCVLEIQSKRDITFAQSDAVFRKVCAQIVRSEDIGIPEEHHVLAVATQRTSRSISGPYQDALQWAHIADASADFFSRLATSGVSNKAMRDFVATFRTNLVTAGAADEDDVIWRVLRRFRILEFDFEATAPLARTYALTLTREVLSNKDSSRAEALWSNLIEISLATGKVGGALNRDELLAELVKRGFRLSGDRNLAPAREKLEESARLTLANIGDNLAGVRLPRLDAIAAVDAALDSHRLVEVCGDPGVGKSWVLRHIAERISRDSHVIVLDPVSTPRGGWSSFAQSLGISSTARVFLNDLATSGGGTLFIDGLDMFTEPGRQRTVNDILREVSGIPGFCVVVTARPDFGADGDSWLAEDAVAALGSFEQVTVGELQESEVAMLAEQAPELRALLDANHPAASIARNLYRLSRLLKLPKAAVIRTEAALAQHWWTSADGAPDAEVRASQRLLSKLAKRALAGHNTLEVQSDSEARSHLLRSLTLREARRDHLSFYHDVLRDWTVAALLSEDPDLIEDLDLSEPVSPRIARGIELAGRLALEGGDGCGQWLGLLNRLSPVGSHGSWRRQALIAIVRSELGPGLLEHCSTALLDDGGALLRELSASINSLETVAAADLLKGLVEPGDQNVIPRSLRANTTGSAAWLLRWCIEHASEIPLPAIGAVLNLIQMQYLILMRVPKLAAPAAEMLLNWLMQLDIREAERTIPTGDGTSRLDHQRHGRLVEELRMWSLFLASHAPEKVKEYLQAVTKEKDHRKANAVRQFSQTLAPVAPVELAALVAGSLIETEEQRSRYGLARGSAFSHAQSDYLPPSPAQPPFFNLLEEAPDIGLALIRQLTEEAVSFHARGGEPDTDGYTIQFDDGPRFFPWTQTYFWSRDQAREYSVASALKALEAWGHLRLDAGEPLAEVLRDVLGPDWSCAAYVLVAVDLLISHWPKSREALVPFISCPELLATERGRQTHDEMGSSVFAMEREPAGKVKLSDLAARASRGTPLERLLAGYLDDGPDSKRVRAQLNAAVVALGDFDADADFADPAFMGAYALNVLDPNNWTEVDEGHVYQSPPGEAEHLARLSGRSSQLLRSSEIEAKIQLAVGDRERSSSELAREALEYADGDFPDDSDPDTLRMRSTRLIATAMLVARDGDDTLLAEGEDWVRAAIDRALCEEVDQFGGSDTSIRYNRPALAICALIHLWHRKGASADRDTIVKLATRSDRSASLAFSAELDTILTSDPKVLKASMRAAFASCRWRWHRYGEDPSEQERYTREKAKADADAVAAEIAWLGGGPEPQWPVFPDEQPHLRNARRMRVPDEKDKADFGRQEPWVPPSKRSATIHADSQAAARWLRLLTGGIGSTIEWREEIVDAYADWSANLNGYGLPREAELDVRNSEWNSEFYSLLAYAFLDMPRQRFDAELPLVTGLPDRAFSNVAETFIHAADVAYFNQPSRQPHRAEELREKLAVRTTKLRGWRWLRETSDLSVDYDTGGVVAKLFMNTHNPFAGTKSYLVPAVFDRLDPLLHALRPMLAGGPTSFIALCTMNTLTVAPRARHIDFLLAAIEAWLERSGNDATMWLELGIGQKIVEWFDRASIEDPSLRGPNHEHRKRIDTAVGRLVDFGVPEAHELDMRIERSE